MSARRSVLMTLLLVGCYCLCACGSLTIRDVEKQEFVPIERGILELHRDIVISPHRTRVFFQKGQIVYGVNEYDPHCQLRVRELSEEAQIVQSDRFSIDEAYGSVDEIVSSGDTQVASSVSANLFAGGGSGDGNGEMRLMYTYHMSLHSDRQPFVTYLVCGGAFEEPAFADYPTLQDIEVALGHYATLTLNVDDMSDLPK